MHINAHQALNVVCMNKTVFYDRKHLQKIIRYIINDKAEVVGPSIRCWIISNFTFQVSPTSIFKHTDTPRHTMSPLPLHPPPQTPPTQPPHSQRTLAAAQPVCGNFIKLLLAPPPPPPPPPSPPLLLLLSSSSSTSFISPPPPAEAPKTLRP